MKKITDPTFRYTPSFDTNVARHLEAHKRKVAKRLRECKSCDPWFDASAFDSINNVCKLKTRTG